MRAAAELEVLAKATADGGAAMLVGSVFVVDGALHNGVALLDGGKVAVYLRGHVGDTGHRNVVVSGNVCDGQTTTSGADAAIAVTSFNGATVRGNEISDAAGAAFRVSFADDVTISGNTVTRSQSNGVAGAVAKRLSVIGNRFTECGIGATESTADNTYSVWVSATEDTTVSGNAFAQSGPFAHAQLTGVRGHIVGNVSMTGGGMSKWNNLTTGGETQP